jgi:hypothetical protein
VKDYYETLPSQIVVKYLNQDHFDTGNFEESNFRGMLNCKYGEFSVKARVFEF